MSNTHTWEQNRKQVWITKEAHEVLYDLCEEFDSTMSPLLSDIIMVAPTSTMFLQKVKEFRAEGKRA